MSDAMAHSGLDGPARGSFRFLSGLSARRFVEVIALHLCPAVASSAVTYAHLNSEWQALLVFVCMLAVGALLRGRRYPLHLIPFASAALYLLAPPLGAALAVAI